MTDPAEPTLARLLPLLPAAGITRLAVLTGLDVLGVPVVAAMRPNSKSVAVHQGKGPTLAAAKVSAIMEAMECDAAEHFDPPVLVRAAGEIGASLDVTRLPRIAGGADPLAIRHLWVEGRTLAGEALWVPRELVTADWSLPAAPGEPCFQASTNGLGAGFSREAALMHALCEVIERDAVALWWAHPAAWRAARSVAPETVDAPEVVDLLARLRAGGAQVTIWDATSDVGVPVFAALLRDAAGRALPEFGFACHPSPARALLAALLEAAQARLTTISGARDDFTEQHYAPGRIAAVDAFAGAPGSRDFGRTRACAGGDVAAVAGALAGMGAGAVACVDLSRPGTGVVVMRVVVPGLEGGRTDEPDVYQPGVRAKAMAAVS